jgi:hypothetical protein
MSTFCFREVVYIEKSIGETFQLQNFKPILVSKVGTVWFLCILVLIFLKGYRYR